MTTKSALTALLREAGVDFVETRSRVMVDVSAISLQSVHKFSDLAIVYFVYKFSDPKTGTYFQRPEVRESIRYYDIVKRCNGVFSSMKAYTR